MDKDRREDNDHNIGATWLHCLKNVMAFHLPLWPEGELARFLGSVEEALVPFWRRALSFLLSALSCSRAGRFPPVWCWRGAPRWLFL